MAKTSEINFLFSNRSKNLLKSVFVTSEGESILSSFSSKGKCIFSASFDFFMKSLYRSDRMSSNNVLGVSKLNLKLPNSNLPT